MPADAGANVSQLGSLYQQLILDHYRSPRHRGEMEGATVAVEVRNPTCGDDIRLMLRVEDDRIVEVKHAGMGCSISQASVSMMSEMLIDRSLSEAEVLAARFAEMMHGDDGSAKDEAMGSLRALAGVRRFPIRVKCALLGFDALQESLKQLRG